MEKTIVIVPAYEEETNITKVIDELNALDTPIDILVVNDGSKDNTYELAKGTKRAHVVDLPVNLGIGGAVQTGFVYAREKGYDIAVQFDGDGQHIAEEIKLLIKPIIEKESDVVIGSRFCEKQEGFKSTITRRMGIKFFEIVNTVLTGKRITDNTSGFRAYNKSAIHFLADNYPHDYPEPEAVILLARNDFKISETFARMRERTGGKSSISGFKTIYYMIKVFLGVIMTAMRARIR